MASLRSSLRASPVPGAVLAPFLVLVLGSCGDPLYDQTLRGDPLYAESLSVEWNGVTAADATDLQVALFFNRGVPGTTNLDHLVELVASRTSIQDLPSRVTLNLFELPDERHMAHAMDGSPLQYGIAHLLSYRDSNQDGRFSPSPDHPDEKIIGRELAIQYMYLPQQLPVSQLPTHRELSAGFHHLFVPQPCGLAPPGPTTPGTCGVPIGDACKTDADCNGGFCLKETQGPWVNGYCVVLEKEDPPLSCRPEAAVYARKPLQAGLPIGAVGYYLKPCSRDADCLRTRDNGTLNFTCDEGLGACRLKDPQSISVGRELGSPEEGKIALEPFCSAVVLTRCDEASLAYALAGGGTGMIRFGCSGTITLSSAPSTGFLITRNTTLDASGQLVTISGGNARRLFKVASGASLTLRNLTLTGGSAEWGAGIYNEGNLLIEKSTLQANIATGGAGEDEPGESGPAGGRSCAGGGGGGAGLGGAIYNAASGTVRIVDSALTGNQARGGRGGLGGSGTCGSGEGGRGGGPNGALGKVSGSTPGGFGGGGSGGAVYASGGASYTGSPGGAGGFGGGGGGGAASFHPELSGYQVSGGMGGTGGGNGGTVTGNLAGVGAGGGGGAGMGGALFNDGGQVLISDSTVTGNVVSGGAGSGADHRTKGLFVGANGRGLGGGIYNQGGTLILSSSVLRTNTADDAPDVSGSRLVTDGPPTAQAVIQNADLRQVLFVRGADGYIYFAWQEPRNGPINNPVPTPGSQRMRGAPAVGRNKDGRLEFFAVGINGSLYHAFEQTPTGSFTEWARLGGSVSGTPAVATFADGRLAVFALGTDGSMYYLMQSAVNNSTIWTSPYPLPGGSLASSPAVIRHPDGRLEVFARGNDGTLWSNWQRTVGGTNWQGWVSLGGSLASAPMITAHADGHHSLFWSGTDGALYARNRSGSEGSWADAVNVGGSGVTGRPAAGATGDGRIELFVLQRDGTIFHRWQHAPNTDTNWGTEPFGDRFSSLPAVCNNADNRLEIFARGVDQSLYHRWWTGNGWSFWESLGSFGAADRNNDGVADGDCNNDLSDGVESDLSVDPQNCGTCGNVCIVGATCERGICAGP